MPTTLTHQLQTIEPPPGRIARFTVEQYHRMIEAGAIHEDDHVELLAGWVVEKMTKNPLHATVAGNLQDAISQILSKGWYLRVQDPIAISDSEPEPDLAIIQGQRNDHLDRHPDAAEIALVIEVAETSLRDDRWKARIYGEAGIPEYWIINIPDRQVEVYTLPAADANAYGSARILDADQPLTIPLNPPIPLACTLRDLLPHSR